MAEDVGAEAGRMGRVACAGIAPNEDLVLGIEKLCLAQSFRNAFDRGALGCVFDATLIARDRFS